MVKPQIFGLAIQQHSQRIEFDGEKDGKPGPRNENTAEAFQIRIAGLRLV